MEQGAGSEAPEAAQLVFAIAHEVGNHLAAIRMQAHLIDEDLDARGLAESSLVIDEQAGRAAPLLALLRPLLSSRPGAGDEARDAGPAPPTGPGSTALAGAPGRWDEVLRVLARRLEDEGTRGVRVEIAPCDAPPPIAPRADWLGPLLQALVGATLAQAAPTGEIRLRVGDEGPSTWLRVEDDGPAEALSPDTALRGRALVIGIARRLVGDLGGTVAVRRDPGWTRIGLGFPRPGAGS